MKSLRRFNLKHHHYFITIVSYNRNQILLNDIDIFLKAWKGREINTWVILPDHLHLIIDIDDEDLSAVIHKFKITYSRLYRNKYGAGRVWQNRYWDHLIRDQEDMNRHIDYIHFNAVKHGYVKKPNAWQHSSFSIYQRSGIYHNDWGVNKTIKIKGDFGE